MALSSIQLEAFLAVSRTQSFTRAAVSLHITQSALSQRIKNLEDDLGATLFTRDAAGILPTDIGVRLLRFCQTREGLETEFMETLKTTGETDLRGSLRVAGYSSINRSILLPALKELLQSHPYLQLELMRAEIQDVPGLLISGRADFALTNEPISRQSVVHKLVGHERNIVAQATNGSPPPNIYLDHHEKDSATFDYFKSVERDLPKGFKRNFVGDMDSIMTAVQLGLGRAIAPKHILKNSKGVEIVKGFTEQRVPVYLNYFEQPFYTELQKAALETLSTEIAARLK